MKTTMTKLSLTAAVLTLTLIGPGCAGVGTRVSKPAPDFNVVVLSGDMSGKVVSLSDFKGRPLVLNIGAVWCPHCLHELPSFIKVYRQHKDDVAVLMVFIKSEREAVDELMKEKDIPFMVAEDPSSAIAKAYGVKGIPVTLFISPDGIITEEQVGGLSEPRLSEKVQDLLEISAKTPAK